MNFWFLCALTKIPHDKLLYVLNVITGFAFKDGTRDSVTVYNSWAFWSQSKCKTGTSYFIGENKSCLQVLINNSFFHVGPKIFREVLSIPMGSDPTPFFANLFLLFQESIWLKSVKNTTCGVAKKRLLFLFIIIILLLLLLLLFTCIWLELAQLSN